MTFDSAVARTRQIAASRFWLQVDEQRAWQAFREWSYSLSKTLLPDLPKVSRDDLIVLRPSKSLGNLVTGTLNFRSGKLTDSKELGYNDTKALLAASATGSRNLPDA